MTIEQILDDRIREVIALSNEAKLAGNLAEMYRLNTAYHWLDMIRQDLRSVTITSSEQK